MARVSQPAPVPGVARTLQDARSDARTLTSGSCRRAIENRCNAATFPLLVLPGIVVEAVVIPHALVVLALDGTPVVAVYLFPGPLIADGDYDRSGIRSEATFYGGQTMVDKTVGSSVPLLLGLILLLGNTASDPLGMRLVGPAAGLLVLAGYLVFCRFDLPARETAGSAL